MTAMQLAAPAAQPYLGGLCGRGVVGLDRGHCRQHGRLRRPGGLPLVALSLLTLLFLAQSASAAIRVDDIPNIDLGTWTPGMGTASVTEHFCVQSDIFGMLPLRWQARVDDLSGASTATEYRIKSPSMGSSVPFAVRLGQSGSRDLKPGALTAIDFAGTFRGCPDGLNARLEIAFPASSLESAAAGSYEGSFSLFAQRFGSDSERFRIGIRIPERVRPFAGR
ncbi:MAG: hypothetical protein VX766_01495 [Pseudomonadota bacterium]|nr:hypothetical protein [Pseudomonadota bacterium]